MMFSAMEQNPDGGAIMIVWCSVDGENGACREWATAICQGGPPPMARTPDNSHWCFSPLARLAVASWEYRDFYGWMCWGRFSPVVVLECKQTPPRLHRECCVYPPVCLSQFARQVVKSESPSILHVNPDFCRIFTKTLKKKTLLSQRFSRAFIRVWPRLNLPDMKNVDIFDFKCSSELVDSRPWMCCQEDKRLKVFQKQRAESFL